MRNLDLSTGKIEINSAYSAQPSIARSNPLVSIAIRHILGSGVVAEDADSLIVADQGCGKLRHMKLLCEHFNAVYLIDREFQLSREQKLFGSNTAIRRYIASFNMPGKTLVVLSNSDFDSSNLNLDIVFNICVFDVEVPKTRRSMASVAYKNLRKGGLYVVIIARNDQSILVRCTTENRYLDGHVFERRGGILTFYKNYRDTKPLIRDFTRQGFVLEADLSKYRQVCLILRKSPEAKTV